ncbi:uncharacterized protein ACA1_181700 [Acanthamoeba castellanii str. Neff]|uniref:Uncharacterized protein n=1 Tax=Acanthamoeba castellanii (strain ATCC 30010 / Neff) TaxID=1257118 RepID=L8HA25_ACACF|nr:uncharacterized protein ACA1_181700 [Acanthamoeba castellanii str. Neff]ELR21281.1 hypothetical protein ACA1_181700 [Acanthamoeba castellanii str. Neff]
MCYINHQGCKLACMFRHICCLHYLLSTVDWLATTLAYKYTNSLHSPADHNNTNAKVYQQPPGLHIAKLPGHP